MSYRKPRIRVELDRWDWVRGKRINNNPIDVIDYLLQYSFIGSIKNPIGQATFTGLPQIDTTNVLDAIEPMDVLRIYEFDVLKYQGYVIRIAYNAVMLQRQPQRSVIITTNSMGNLLTESQLGLNIGAVTGNVVEMADSAVDLFIALSNVVEEGGSFSDLMKAVIDNWFIMIDSLGGTTYTQYITNYLDFSSGLISKHKPAVPKSLDIYTGNEESLTLGGLFQQLLEIPLNELWFSVGPQKIRINNVDVTFIKDKTCLILRETPFDGTVGGSSSTYWTDYPAIKVDLDHLTRFDLSKSMEEAYTIFGAIPSIFDPGSPLRILLGQTVFDTIKLSKYLYKPLITQLKFIRTQDLTEDAIEKANSSINKVIANVAKTLKAWFINNDEFISGVISLHVPENNKDDPHIGQKIEVEGIDGFFYVESVAHTWKYQGNLISNLTVTRGYDGTKKMTFVDKLFTRSIL